MEIKIPKHQLKSVYNFLDKIKPVGKLSRAKVKLMKLLEDASLELSEDVQLIKKDTDVSDDLRKEYSQLLQSNKNASDDKFKPLQDENKDLQELFKEDAIMDATKHKRLINELYIYLEDFPEELETADSYAHDLLLTAIEENHTDVTDQFTGGDSNE